MANCLINKKKVLKCLKKFPVNGKLVFSTRSE